MKIKQIFNNNVILSENEKGEEIILVGRGIAFGVSKGSTVDEQKVEKKFEFQEDLSRRFKKLITDIPYEYILISEEIVDFIRSGTTKKINDSIHISLTDHIANVVERVKMGIVFDPALLLNVKSLYPEEYKLGLKVARKLRERLGIEIDDSEANFIALHIINAEMDSNIQQMYDITLIIEDIVGIVKEEFTTTNIEDILWDRFITHCRFFAQRVLKKEYISTKSIENTMTLQIFEMKHPQQQHCIERICKHMIEKFSYEISVDEKLYIMLHLIKLTE